MNLAKVNLKILITSKRKWNLIFLILFISAVSPIYLSIYTAYLQEKWMKVQK